MEAQADIDVTREDQEKINRFGRLNAEMHETEDTLKAQQEALSAVQDAQSEALLADADGAVKLQVGESYFDLAADDVVDVLGRRETELQTQVDAAGARLAEIKAEMAQLKSQLYAKFGRNAINLDED